MVINVKSNLRRPKWFSTAPETQKPVRCFIRIHDVLLKVQRPTPPEPIHSVLVSFWNLDLGGYAAVLASLGDWHAGTDLRHELVQGESDDRFALGCTWAVPGGQSRPAYATLSRETLVGSAPGTAIPNDA